MEEMSAILSHLPAEILTLDSFPQIGDIPETGVTLKENAFIKAETVHKITGLPALADDTGLEVDALDGAPGVFSARYAGEDATFYDNCTKLIKELDHIPSGKRTARFRTVISFVKNEKKLWTEGVVEGVILDHMKGEGGFGYDDVTIEIIANPADTITTTATSTRIKTYSTNPCPCSSVDSGICEYLLAFLVF